MRKFPLTQEVRLANITGAMATRICDIFGIANESEAADAVNTLCGVGLQLQRRGTDARIYRQGMKEDEQQALETLGRLEPKAYGNILRAIQNAVEEHKAPSRGGRRR